MKNILILSLFLFGCSVSAEIENVCVVSDADLPGVDSTLDIQQVNGQIVFGTVSRSTNQDISQVVGKIEDFADVSLNFKKLNLSTTDDFSFVQEIKTTATQDGKTIMISDDYYSFTGKEKVKEISMRVKDKERLLEMLQKGSVQLELLVSGKIPNETTNALTDLCVGVDGEMK